MQNPNHQTSNQTTSDQDQNLTTIISIILVLTGILAIAIAIVTKCLINKRKRLNNRRNNGIPQPNQQGTNLQGTELRKFNRPPRIDTQIPSGSHLIQEISYPQAPQIYY